MFWRILGQLFSASRGRLAVALLALASGAAVTTALINLNLDAERKVSGEFRTLGANAVILPSHSREAMLASLKRDEFIEGKQINDDVPSSPLMSWRVITDVQTYSKDNQIVSESFSLCCCERGHGNGLRSNKLCWQALCRIARQSLPLGGKSLETRSNPNDSADCLIGIKRRAST